jgi:NADPH-dependent curcumin reductase CurA
MIRSGGHPMSENKNGQWILIVRPTGKLTGDEFRWSEAPIPRLVGGQVLVRNLWLSFEPAQRTWMVRETYRPKVPLGTVMSTLAVGQAVESRHPDFKPGDEKALYVTTDRGFLIPHQSGIQDAKLVRMEVGESGWPLPQGA